MRFEISDLDLGRRNSDEDLGGFLAIIHDLMGEGGVEVECFLRFEVVFLNFKLDLDVPVKNPHEFFHAALIMLYLRLAIALEGQKERRDLFLVGRLP